MGMNREIEAERARMREREETARRELLAQEHAAALALWQQEREKEAERQKEAAAKEARRLEMEAYLRQAGAFDLIEEVRRDVWHIGDISYSYKEDRHGEEGKWESSLSQELIVELRYEYPRAVDNGSESWYEPGVDGTAGSTSVSDPYWEIETTDTTFRMSVCKITGLGSTYATISINDSEGGGGLVDFKPVDGPSRENVRAVAIAAVAKRVDKGKLPSQLEASARAEIRARVPLTRRLFR